MGRVETDGNCLFRSFSVVIYGTEDHHEEIRGRLGDFLEENPEDANSLLVKVAHYKVAFWSNLGSD